MANYFVINNKFRPYSFDELIKPYQIYGQAYKEQEALLEAAKEKEFSPANLDRELDSAAYNMYNTATEGLRAASDELARKGLSSDLRSRIKTSAADYKRTMDALTTAQAKLDAERTRRTNLGNDYVYRQEDVRIGDFLNGGIPDQTAVKLSDLKKDIATEFATRAGTISKETWNRVLNNNGRVIGGYYDVTTQTGLTDAQLNSILDNTAWKNTLADPNISRQDKETLERFRNVIASKLDAIGYSNYGTDARKLINRAVNEGAAAGLGTTKHSYQKDLNFESPELRFQKEKFNTAQQENERLKRISRGELPFYTDPEGNKWFTDGYMYWKHDKNGKEVIPPTAKTALSKDSEQDAKAFNAMQALTENQEFPFYMQDSRPGWFTSNDSTSAYKGGISDFNEANNRLISLEEFGETRRERLKDILKEYNKNYKTNLTLNDVQIYKDTDLFTNEYKIVLRGQVIGTVDDDGSSIPTPTIPTQIDTTTINRRGRSASSLPGIS